MCKPGAGAAAVFNSELITDVGCPALVRNSLAMRALGARGLVREGRGSFPEDLQNVIGVALQSKVVKTECLHLSFEICSKIRRTKFRNTIQTLPVIKKICSLSTK